MPAVDPLFDEAAIARRVEELAAEIAASGRGDLVVVGILKGAFLFHADLVRALGRQGISPDVDFLRAASYGAGQESSGGVRVGDAPASARGRRVLLADTILDTGRTLAAAKRAMEVAGADEVRTCVLVDKPGRRNAAVTPDFVGFAACGDFLVGYGTDEAEHYRSLPFIGVRRG